MNFTKYQWSSNEIQSKELIFRVANQEGNIAFPWPAGSNDKHDASRCFPCLEPDNAPRAVVSCRGVDEAPQAPAGDGELILEEISFF